MSTIDKSRFKNAQGTNYLNALFFEETGADKSTVIYTLKDEDHLGYPSLYRLYMDVADPTEYKFAITHLDGWQHWEKLLACKWFEPYVSRWRRELELRLRSWALANIIHTANSSGKEAFPANRYLLEGNWKPAGEKKSGRPTKVAIIKEAHQIALEREETAIDYKRLMKEIN